MKISDVILKNVLNDEGGFVLHRNKGETADTFGGIYKRYHKEWKGWRFVDTFPVGDIRVVEGDERYSEIFGLWRDYVLKTQCRITRLDLCGSDFKKELTLSLAFLIDSYSTNKLLQSLVYSYKGRGGADGVMGVGSWGLLNSLSDSEFFDRVYVGFTDDRLDRVGVDKGSVRYLSGWNNRFFRILERYDDDKLLYHLFD